MLIRTHRFHGHNSLTYVYRHGAGERTQQLAVRYIKNSRRKDYRLAVIVSKKVHKSAVARNRVRRRIFEIVRTGPAIAEAYDIVVTVFSDQIIDTESAKLTTLVRNLFKRAGLYHNDSGRANRSGRAIVKSERDV